MPYTRAVAGSGRIRDRARLSRTALDLGALAVAALAVAAVYLSIFWRRDLSFPVGYDTPKYLWRTALVGANGFGSLAGAAPEPFRSNPDRVGFPLLVSAASSLLGVSASRLVMVLPAAMATTIGLGAAAFARTALAMPRWAAAVFVLAVGASPNVSRMAAPGYLDNLLVAGLVVAGVVGALHAANALRGQGRAASIGAVGVLVAGVLTHWIFVLVVAAILLAVALAALPWSIGTWRAGRRPLGTPSGRLATIVGGAAAIGGAALLTLVGSEPSPPRLPRAAFQAKLAADAPRYGLAVTGPLAAVGAAWAALRLRLRVPMKPDGTAGSDAGAGQPIPDVPRPASLGSWLMLIWALTGAAAVALLTLGRSVPAHRFLAFDLGIPLLVATGLVAVARLLLGINHRVRAALAATVVVLALAGTTVIAYRAWSGTISWIPPKQFEQASVAGRYLQRVSGTTPVVFIVDLGGASPAASTSEAFHVIRTGLAPNDITRTYEFLGRPEDFLAGNPTLRADPAFNLASLQHWPSVRAILDEHPIALMMRAFVRGFGTEVAAHPEWSVGPDLAVVQGPRPPGPLPPLQAVPQPLGAPALFMLWAAFLAVLALTGGGWASLAVRADPAVRAALMPGFGIAALVLGAVVADRLGVRMEGAGGAIVIAVVAAAGWVAFLAMPRAPSRRRPGRRRSPSPVGRSSPPRAPLP